MPFAKLGLSAPVVEGVKAMGYTEPTPIQLRAIPLVLEGKDVIGSAQTGTGKTAAFALPILTKMGHHEPRTRFLKNLVDLARSLDDARLVSAAMEVTTDPADDNHKIVDDPFGAYTDLLSFNEYVGWYVGLPDKLQKIRWTLKYEKPVVISEFGAGALQGFHGDKLTRFSEEFQEDVYRQTLAMLQKIPAWRGATPWILCDFRSPRRPLAHMQDGWNRKGLIGENGTKKKAFYVLKEFYDQKATASGGDAP